MRARFAFLALAAVLPAQQTRIAFTTVPREKVEARLREASSKQADRAARLQEMLAQAGCSRERMQVQNVKHSRYPNLICTLPGSTDSQILVGAHFDLAGQGQGVVDNWSGAALLASVFESLRDRPRKHTFVFVGFAAEEQGLVGSRFYVSRLSPEQQGKIRAMVNLDSLGLTPTKVWVNRSDEALTEYLARVAQAMKSPIAGVNVEKVGTSDSQSFAEKKIPVVTIHSVTQETWPILHSSRDRVSAISLDDYYETYRLVCGYLAFLDGVLE